MTAAPGRWKRCAVALLVLALAAATRGATPAAAGDAERGEERLRSGDYAGAAEAFRAAIAASPENRDARYGLARALAFSGDPAGGEREYRALLERHPGDVEARLGLADVLAWQNRYREAEEVLAPMAAERPADIEVLIRRGKVALWSGDLSTARERFEAVLALSPGNAEGLRGIASVSAAVAATLRREVEAGISLLRISNAGPGTQAWSAYRDRTRPGYTVTGRADYLHRYGRDEGRGTLGGTRKWDGGSALRLEAGVSPGADIFSRVAVEGELGRPLADRVVGYLAGKYSHFSTADSWNAGLALECYVLPKRSPLLVRYVLTQTRFDGGGDSTDGTWLVKASHHFTDDDRVWAYYSHGAEGYLAGTIDQVVAVSSDSYGAGGRYFPRPAWGIEGNFDWQQRRDDVRYITFTVSGHHRF
jgi:YaiO family outer membrane protein